MARSTLAYEEPGPVRRIWNRRRAQVGQPLDLPEALTTSTAISRDAFSVIGSTVTLDVQVVQLGPGHSGWVGKRMVAVDDGFLSGIKANLIRRAPGDSNADVWHALHNHPGMAVVSAALVGDTGLSVPASSGFRPLSIWMRPEDGGQPVKLTVFGVIDPRSQLPDGIYTSRATAAGMGIDLPSPSVYYLEPRQGVKAGDTVNGLRVSFANQGLAPAALSDRVQTAQLIQLLRSIYALNSPRNTARALRGILAAEMLQ